METPLNNSPFFIGQEVVALKTIPHKESGGIKKGQPYIVLGLQYCEKCNTWSVGFAVKPPPHLKFIRCYCGDLLPRTGFWKAKSDCFAPVTRLRISSELTIASDLLKDAEPEVIDYEPEKVEV